MKTLSQLIHQFTREKGKNKQTKCGVTGRLGTIHLHMVIAVGPQLRHDAQCCRLANFTKLERCSDFIHYHLENK